jgi:hypothetical protein
MNPLIGCDKQRNHSISAKHSLLKQRTRILFSSFGNDQPAKQVGKKTGDAPGYQGNEECQPEPECTDAKEFCQASANTCHDMIAAGPA